MNRIRFKAFVLLTVSFLFSGSIFAHADAHPADLTPVSSQGEILINANDEFLVKVLLRVSKESGIIFRVPNELTSTKITAAVQAVSWNAGVDDLLNAYSILKVWGPDKKLKRVVLLKRKDGAANLEKEQQKEDIGFSLLRLPDHVLQEPGLVAYLRSLGIEVPPEVEQRMTQRYIKNREEVVGKSPLPPHVREDPELMSFLDSLGAPLP